MSLTECREKGRLGGTPCYEVVTKQVGQLLERIHNATSHKGRVPGTDTEAEDRARERADLLRRLEEAVRAEDYEAAASIRDELRANNLPWHQPDANQYPTEEELLAAAHVLIRRALRTASVRGAVGGAGGAFAIPPEVALAMVQTLRLGQRLAVLYGFELETDRGRLILSRALESAYQLDLPDQRSLGVRISDLPQVARQRLPDVQKTTAWITRTVAWRVARHVGGRLSRILPGVGAGIGAWDAYRSIQDHGKRMIGVYQRAWDGGIPDEEDIVDAIEIAPTIMPDEVK